MRAIDSLRRDRSYVGAVTKTRRSLPVLLSSVGTLLLVFVLSTTTLAHRHRPVLLPTPPRPKTKITEKKIEMKMKQHWKRAVQHVYVPKHDLRIVIIIPLFFRGCLSESPPRTHYRFTLLQITAPRSRPFRGPGIVDCSRIQVKFIKIHKTIDKRSSFFLSSACLDKYRTRETRLFKRVKNGKRKWTINS